MIHLPIFKGPRRGLYLGQHKSLGPGSPGSFAQVIPDYPFGLSYFVVSQPRKHGVERCPFLRCGAISVYKGLPYLTPG